MSDQPTLLDHLNAAVEEVLPRRRNEAVTIADTILAWRDVIAQLNEAGLVLARQKWSGQRSGESHQAEWLAAGVLPGGGSIGVRVRLFTRRERWRDRWRIDAHTLAPAGMGPHGPVEAERAKIELRDPTVAEALAACTVLGIGAP